MLIPPAAVIVTCVVTVPPAEGTNGLVAKLTASPLAGEAESVTAEENVPEDFMVRIEVAAEP